MCIVVIDDEAVDHFETMERAIRFWDPFFDKYVSPSERAEWTQDPTPRPIA